MVAKKLKAKNCISFQTILQRQYFSGEQVNFFNKGYDKLGDNKFVVVDDNSLPIHQIKAKNDYFISINPHKNNRWVLELEIGRSDN